MTDTMTSQNIDLSSWETMYLIYELSARAQLNIVLLIEYLLHVSALTAPFSGRTRITSQNHLLILRSRDRAS
jgi:hypothetical protein